jgi:DNA-binding NtrC family response regulator
MIAQRTDTCESDAPEDGACRHGLIGRSQQIHEVRRLIDKAARTPFSVLLLGESGTGKEIVARAIHQASSRASRPFVVVDCGSLVGTLMESELFGYVKGAFSSAAADKAGLVEAADKGTLFLDEIGELPLELQVKLLRLIQEGECRPVGSVRSQKADLRIIAATHRDLAEEVKAGRFRLDLYHRLNVFPIHLPALRHHAEDVPQLVDHFIGQLAELGFSQLRLAEGTIGLLQKQAWPGNVRELKHAIERMAALSGGDVLEWQDAAGATLLLRPDEAAREAGARDERPEAPQSIPEAEARLIAAALTATGGRLADAAGLLRISRTTLYRRLKKGPARAWESQRGIRPWVRAERIPA